MIYLLVKMLVLLLIAAGLGGALGWHLRESRDRERLKKGEADAAARIADLRAARDAAEAKVNEAAAAEASAAADATAPLEAKLTEREEELTACREALAAAEKRLGDAEAALAECERKAAAEVAPGGDDVTASPAPLAMSKPDDGGDDLQAISGIGPKIAEQLHEMGIWRYAQIAALTPEQTASINEHLRFKGRIERENWIEQARALAGDKAH